MPVTARFLSFNASSYKLKAGLAQYLKKVRNMKNKKLFVATCFLAAFALWTLLVSFVDVRAIGPEGSSVGFASLNRLFHELIGVNTALYTLTDWLGLIPIATALGFALLGLIQFIKRKSLWDVDYSILALGVFYVIVAAVYVFFEIAVINRRPTLIDGRLEASYPSSTTVLVTCVMPTAIIQLKERIKNPLTRRCAIVLITVFSAFMVIGRILSGVHWITDIIGGILLSAGLVIAYGSLSTHK